MADNGLVGLLGIYVMRDMFFAENIKKQPPETKHSSGCFERMRRENVNYLYLLPPKPPFAPFMSDELPPFWLFMSGALPPFWLPPF